ncbi:MAG: RNA methyltransferase, partial [Thermodesulfovibrionales bacterium]|nr:RNA methyltransferase [Thermodesulfovibrionales bacterium]
VVFDGVSDPGNLGTMIRTADASGASGVIVLEGTCDVFGPKALRASAGSVFNIPIMHSKRENVLEELKAMGIRIAATVPEGGEDLYNVKLVPPLAIVFGNESKGVGKEFMAQADLVVSVPVRGGAESLNVAAAAAVLLYEALRQGVTDPL